MRIGVIYEAGDKVHGELGTPREVTSTSSPSSPLLFRRNRFLYAALGNGNSKTKNSYGKSASSLRWLWKSLPLLETWRMKNFWGKQENSCRLKLSSMDYRSMRSLHHSHFVCELLSFSSSSHDYTQRRGLPYRQMRVEKIVTELSFQKFWVQLSRKHFR